MVHEEGCQTFEGSFPSFALSFVRRLLDVDRYQGIEPEALEFLEPEDLEELVAWRDRPRPAELRTALNGGALDASPDST
ncbi:hypothetical protein AB8A21_31700 [Streptomyces sp. BF23-18]|uniref:hypothetical protein n=1 Tax=Streptomyces sp. BF23-18 TaxID=3240282 RepID=UPI0034E3FF83